MGFGFNLFAFPILILATVVLSVYFFSTKKKGALLILGLLWGLTISLFILAAVADHYRAHIRLTKQDIIGEYRIDTTFFPGRNAKWQYDHYKFFITPNDSFLFVEMKDNEIERRLYNYKIKYNDGPPALWLIECDRGYRVTKNKPTLYRGRNTFYYVFRSDKFGNMFFRKLKETK